MAPIRRYLRITKHSVLEVRIYLDNPALAQSWLLNSRDPVLPRIIDSIRPLVLPKLREENENSKRKSGKKKKGVRDVVVQDDFEVSIFLTETSTHHALLTKQKTLTDKPLLKSNANKLTSWANTSDNPIHVDDDKPPQILQEEDAEEISLDQIPEANASRRKRGKKEESIFVNSDDEDEGQEEPSSKRKKVTDASDQGPTDDKKKLSFKTAYEGFSIYGRILCLIVKRRGIKKLATDAPASGSEMLENWVSTQAQNDGLLDDDDR
ncbi:hypothetical protein AAFC00_006401 [Neodothiora populina]|uniref:Uncharacterized protein n=1 Tax=Neodothiora populina TaxID=2781224 RepID=A0ABR3P565_9PEZI